MSRERKGRWDLNSRFLIGQPGNPMLERWRLLQTPWFGVYVHFIYREDIDPVAHDHPWNFWRVVLRGGYTEQFFASPAYVCLAELDDFARRIERWLPSCFRTDQAHWISQVDPGTISLVLVGRKKRAWGFWTPEKLPGGTDYAQWTDYRDALDLRPNEGSRSQHPGSYPAAS